MMRTGEAPAYRSIEREAPAYRSIEREEPATRSDEPGEGAVEGKRMLTLVELICRISATKVLSIQCFLILIYYLLS